MTLPEITTRQRTPRQTLPSGKARDPTSRAEVAQALGPVTMGEPLDGSYQALHAVPWRLEWHEGGGLHLYQQQMVEGELTWVEVTPGQPFPPLTDSCRHISLAFDQSARHVVAWEDAGQVWVRQWDNTQLAYTMRGPWPGVDPLLLMDTTVHYWTPISDVVLLSLSPDRTALHARLQRDAYGTVYALDAGLDRAVLDQVIPHPYHAQLLGERWTGNPPAPQQAVWDLGLYPTRATDDLLGSGEVSGLLDIVAHLVDPSHTLTGLGELSGLYESDAGQQATHALTGLGELTGAYESGFIWRLTDALTGTGSLTGALPTVAVPVNRLDALTGTGSISGGTYGP